MLLIMRSRIKAALRWTPHVLLALVAMYMAFADGWKDLTLGRFHRKAQAIFTDFRGVNRVEIYLLHPNPGQMPTGQFSMSRFGDSENTYGMVTLTGEDAAKFLESWGHQLPSFQSRAMCFEPVYGFRLYQDTKLITETSICWECSGFYVPVWPFLGSSYGFDSRSKAAKNLLSICDDHLPYPKPTKPEQLQK